MHRRPNLYSNSIHFSKTGLEIHFSKSELKIDSLRKVSSLFNILDISCELSIAIKNRSHFIKRANLLILHLDSKYEKGGKIFDLNV